MLLSTVGFIFISGIQLAVCHSNREEKDQNELVFAHVVRKVFIDFEEKTTNKLKLSET